ETLGLLRDETGDNGAMQRSQTGMWPCPLPLTNAAPESLRPVGLDWV
ncbi:hypothetical protein QQF64_012019, partial [Cirrhinus molitorella]